MKGRPIGSIIRNRICVILSTINIGYGYEIYKIYKEIFGNVHIRTIYYNLKKGIEKEEIILLKVEKEVGNYSWGNEVQKIYYIIGPYANIQLPAKDSDLIKKISGKYLKKGVEINWENELKNIVNVLRKEIEDYKKRYDVLSNQGKKLIKMKITQKSEKLKDYAKSKISKEKFNELFKELNPPTL